MQFRAVQVRWAEGKGTAGAPEVPAVVLSLVMTDWARAWDATGGWERGEWRSTR